MTAPRTVRHLTVADLAARWDTTRWAIYARKKRGDVPPPMRLTSGKRGPLRWNEKDVEAWERQHLIRA